MKVKHTMTVDVACSRVLSSLTWSIRGSMPRHGRSGGSEEIMVWVKLDQRERDEVCKRMLRGNAGELVLVEGVGWPVCSTGSSSRSPSGVRWDVRSRIELL